jgi:hypothetical protein
MAISKATRKASGPPPVADSPLPSSTSFQPVSIGLTRVVLLYARVECDRRKVKNYHGEKQIDRQSMQADHSVAQILTDQVIERTVECNVVIAEKACADLKAKQGQKCEDRQ